MFIFSTSEPKKKNQVNFCNLLKRKYNSKRSTELVTPSEQVPEVQSLPEIYKITKAF